MATLETQYNRFLSLKSGINLSFNEWKEIHANQTKQALIDMMKDDEELGLYDDTKANMISDWLEQNRNPEIDKQVEKELEYLSRQEIKLEDVFNDEKRQGVKDLIDKYKQETLEEAEIFAETKYQDEIIRDVDVTNLFQKAFVDGAKWQQEQDKNKYSEEDMKSFADWIRNGLLNIEYSVDKLDKHLQQWKQFKNK